MAAAVHCWKVYADRLQCDVESEAHLHELIYEDFYLKYPASIQVRGPRSSTHVHPPADAGMLPRWKTRTC